jgi:flagellar protein FlaG
MDVNLSALQDASAGSYSGAVPKGGVVVPGTSAVVTPAVDVKVTATSETSNNSGQNQQKELSPEEMQNVAADLTKFMKSLNTDIKFAIHEKTGRMMVRVVDSKDQVLKEFPSHELLDTIAAISEYVGALLDKKA